jgi:ABC-type multidrug transport system fused ATPase/permease subunit
VSKFIEILIQFTIVLVGLIAIATGELVDGPRYLSFLSFALQFMGILVCFGVFLVNLFRWRAK